MVASRRSDAPNVAPHPYGSHLLSRPSLYELPRIAQVPGEPQRRWFTSPSFNLTVWYSESGDVKEFHLHLDWKRMEKVFVWADGALSPRYYTMDDGDPPGWAKSSILMNPVAPFDLQEAIRRFQLECDEIDGELAKFVIEKMRSSSSLSA